MISALFARNVPARTFEVSKLVVRVCALRQLSDEGRQSFRGRDNNRGYGGDRNSRGGYGRGERNNRRPTGSARGARSKGEPPLRLSNVVRVTDDQSSKDVTLDGLHQSGVIDTELHKAVSRMNFESLTPVQQKTIKPILETEHDVIARAKTGTGKTLAFLVPIFEHLIKTRTESPYMVKCVIVAPTRDLALQIDSEIEKLHKNNYALKKFKSIALIGGSNFQVAIKRMFKDRPNIVVATPGRLIDVMSKFSDKFFTHVDFKVLDEADRLLEIGFDEDLRDISKTLNSINATGPEHIRTLLFSATLGDSVQKLAAGIMNRKESLFLDTVDVNEPEAHEKIDQRLVISENFTSNLCAPISAIKTRLATNNEPYKAILFVPTVKFTKFYCTILERLFPSLPVYEFHGKIDQRKRTKMVGLFKRAHEGIFVCTDVGARGMDFPGVEEVLQLGVPSELSNYIHRIGRTARGGKEGRATIYLFKDELPFIDTLAREKNVKIVDQDDYAANKDDIEEFNSCLRDEYMFREGLESMLSFYKGCEQSYGFYMPRVARQIANAYGQCLIQPDKKMPISRSTASMRYGLKGRIVEEIFDCGSSHRESYDNEERFPSRSNRFRNSGSRSNQGGYDSGRRISRQRWESDDKFDTKRFRSPSRGENPRIDNE
ncbi:LAQU0S04e08922g1_1 [Lachancea quebecensis]|uniref:ATP-dependent RNA helicase n=1 Tax=Lachancea quebecensis TaxID=1654605 RepID=A0A0P1KRN9_9SACH|nr:LAQU0S04e08922g1_1 [Lachancea quebecensis]